MISAMGDLEGKGKGGFVLLDEDFKVGPPVSQSTKCLCSHLVLGLNGSTPVFTQYFCIAGEGSMVRHDHRVWL